MKKWWIGGVCFVYCGRVCFENLRNSDLANCYSRPENYDITTLYLLFDQLSQKPLFYTEFFACDADISL